MLTPPDQQVGDKRTNEYHQQVAPVKAGETGNTEEFDETF
jgi:hypothetical protein